jgi:hypothetical protein
MTETELIKLAEKIKEHMDERKALKRCLNELEQGVVIIQEGKLFIRTRDNYTRHTMENPKFLLGIIKGLLEEQLQKNEAVVKELMQDV